MLSFFMEIIVGIGGALIFFQIHASGEDESLIERRIISSILLKTTL
jgi:hypothetical protein